MELLVLHNLQYEGVCKSQFGSFVLLLFILNYLSFTNMFLLYPIPTQVLGYLMIYKII
jgi:hypothetical protein